MRGIVEGFYGTPWSHEARLDAITFLAPRGLNAYVYAPKKNRAVIQVAATVAVVALIVIAVVIRTHQITSGAA